MGYNFHITRKNRWSDRDGLEISLEEWLSAVKSDPEMRLDGGAEATNPKTGEVLRYENEGLAIWTAYSGARGGSGPWFDYRRGNIVVKNPDQVTLKKMWAVAQHLFAKVQGDEGETYDPTGNMAGE